MSDETKHLEIMQSSGGAVALRFSAQMVLDRPATRRLLNQLEGLNSAEPGYVSTVARWMY
jgi:hypothetical protein